MKWQSSAVSYCSFLCYPLLFFELFGSVTMALAAPLLAIWKTRFVEDLDLYWISIWCMLLALPAVVLGYKLWGTRRRVAVLVLTGAMLVASF